ncbi:hypothetical protein LRN48_14945, partial [Staphylococcus aureus]|nr:hypothetical protein [Staphylococcus aureus]
SVIFFTTLSGAGYGLWCWAALAALCGAPARPLMAALVLGGVFLYYAWRLMDPPDEFYAMRVFNYSIVYLMALFAFLLLDHWLMP